MSVLTHDWNTELRRLSRQNVKLLNPFARGQTSHDPFSRLQNPKSQAKYITTRQLLLCSWGQMVVQGQLRDAVSAQYGAAGGLGGGHRGRWQTSGPPPAMHQ
jgi:hypothetical protein